MPEIARLEIGYTWYGQSWQRTHVNTVCKYLMLFYAFESLKANVVGWRTDNLNQRSQNAIERLAPKRTVCCAATPCVVMVRFATPICIV